MSVRRVDFGALDSSRDALERLEDGSSVEGIPDSEIAALWAAVEERDLAVRLRVHRGGWRIVPGSREATA